ncbi:MAG: phosphatidate cytidylyltransferase [Anaerolineaceae bacterium]|nr:phosphatidate cytidylyltransferase [Anaerolineaceae bacterium]
MDANLRARVRTALLVGPLIVLLVVAGGPGFLLAVLVAGALGGYELAQLPGNIPRRVAIAMALCVPALSLAVACAQAWLLLVLLAPALAGLRSRRAFRRAFLPGTAGALYVGVALGLLLLLRSGEDGRLWTLVLFANNWSADSVAMLGGRRFGRHRLAPSISPGKTVEGALLGLLAGVVAGLALAAAGGLPLALALPLNLGVALATLGGDLLESLLKRQWQAEDSGTLLPGHGGLLDRMDGTLLAAPVLWLLVQVF